jgi:hypothetical protein
MTVAVTPENLDEMPQSSIASDQVRADLKVGA